MFWSSLTDGQRAKFEAAGTMRNFANGAVLFAENETTAHAVVILQGRVKLSRVSRDGHELLIELRGPGSLLGELAAIDGGRRIATARAITPVVSIVIPAGRFRELLLSDPRLSLTVLTLVADKLRQATDRRLTYATSDVMARLAGRLLELASEGAAAADGSIEIRSPLSQQELAEWIGASRDSVVIALRALRRDGLISTARRTIRIHRIEPLRQIARAL